ncbi:putative membrane protein [Thermobifida fusca YX]|uniref:Putative membrane protein n=2 Tax=Thermobifida fusca TaxID=2021 RepID=Q47SB1_THEFY|nr:MULTISPECIES: DUF3152 domain-containing protein [Thermobifida]AAZ54656.1 putative membrane protein [Thermobifida fusca YX]MBO2529485.1 DUF3152 domain-containing protein [Thermobifida sp.]PPS96404.1 hypothetical protein BH05_00085 [Thermobifida fusca]PZN66811.1 MAG: DUF3152 domain-containing protein [Thermobifida fusca]
MTAQKAGRPRRTGRHRRRQLPVGTIAGLIVALSGVGMVSANVLPWEPSDPASVVPATSQGSSSPMTPEPSPSPVPPLLRSVVEEVPSASGELRVVEGDGEVVGEGTLLRYLVEVEEGLPGDPADFAAAVEHVLSDPRSWTHDGTLAFQRVDEEPVDFRVTLASPETVDQQCAPLQTNGYVSCFSGERAMINQNRWVSGVPHFDGDLETYRAYVINHEVGHALGYGHVDCPAPGEPAPVMQQQTFGLQGCEKNGWVSP